MMILNACCMTREHQFLSLSLIHHSPVDPITFDVIVSYSSTCTNNCLGKALQSNSNSNETKNPIIFN